MEDIQSGCEDAVTALKGWIAALAARDFDYLERHFADDFAFTCDPKVRGGRMDKRTFIEFDRHVHDAKIELLALTARRWGDMVTMLQFARVQEEFRGDLGPGTPSAAEMNELIRGKTFAYGTGWRLSGGRWLCFDHHIFGAVG